MREVSRVTNSARDSYVESNGDKDPERDAGVSHSAGFGDDDRGLRHTDRTRQDCAGRGSSHVDEYAAIAAVTFLASALTSYLSIRCSNRPRLSTRIERVADMIFLGGLVGITLVATLFAYEVI